MEASTAPPMIDHGIEAGAIAVVHLAAEPSPLGAVPCLHHFPPYADVRLTALRAVYRPSPLQHPNWSWVANLARQPIVDRFSP